MGTSRRVFSKEFKAEAVERLQRGASAADVARALEVNPNVVHRWRREAGRFGSRAFGGYGNNRQPVPPRTRAVVFRLTEEEFQRLKSACLHGGARSLSEFARSQVLGASVHSCLSQIEAKLDQLALAVRHLSLRR